MAYQPPTGYPQPVAGPYQFGMPAPGQPFDPQLYAAQQRAASDMQRVYGGQALRINLNLGSPVAAQGGAYMPIAAPQMFQQGQLVQPSQQAQPLSQQQQRQRIAVDQENGTIKVIVLEGKQLHDTQCCGKQDPYVRVTYGHSTQKTSTDYSGGQKPKFVSGNVLFFPLVPSKKKKRNKDYNTIKVEVWNRNLISDDFIGKCEIDVEMLFREIQEPEKERWFELTRGGREHVKGGELKMTLKYVAPLIIRLHRAQNLRNVQWIGKQDPYVILTYRGPLGKGEKNPQRTKEHTDGALNPHWEEEFRFNIREAVTGMNATTLTPTSGPRLELQVMDAEITFDRPIAWCSIPLGRLLEIRGMGEKLFDLHKGEPGKGSTSSHAGEIIVSVR